MNLRFVTLVAAILSVPFLAPALNNPMYNKYYNSGDFTFNGRTFDNLSEDFAHSQYSAKDPDSKFLLNESSNKKYRFDYNRENIGDENLMRYTETSSSGSEEKRYIESSTATFYKNEKLRARTLCVSEAGDTSLHCATVTQNSCIAILDKYQALTKSSKEKPALLSKDTAENDKNVKTCENLLKGYSEIAIASQKYLSKGNEFNKIAQQDADAIQKQTNSLFGKKALFFSNISVKENNVDTTLKAAASADFAASPSGLGFIQNLVKTCRESLRDFDTSRLNSSGAKDALSKIKGGQTGTQ